MARITNRIVPAATGASAKRKPSCATASGLSTAVIATAPAGGCTARKAIVAAMVSDTANATASAGVGTVRQMPTPISAASVLPTMADQGCASGLFGTEQKHGAGSERGDQIKAQSCVHSRGQDKQSCHTQTDKRADACAQNLQRACGRDGGADGA